MLADYRTAPLTPAFAALLALIEKITRDSLSVTDADIETVKAAGMSEEAIYDAITVCSLFQFYNTWVDASGVPALETYEHSGKRMAKNGYVPD